MAKFGQCCCSVCCLTTGEFDAAFTTIKINGEGTTISHDGCCHYASRTITGAPKQVWCKQYFGYQYTESATIQQKLIKTKKIGGGSYAIGDTGCPAGYDPPDEPAEWACDDVRDCGKTERTIGQIVQGWGVVDGYLRELRVAIYQAHVSCGGEVGECKYVVQCSAKFQLRFGAGGRNEFPRTTVKTTQGVCCEETPPGADGLGGIGDQYDYHPTCDLPDVGTGSSFDCNAFSDWSGGGFYWISRYKIYDTIADIPSSMSFTDSDTTDCVFVPCGDGDQELCFEFLPPTQTYRDPRQLQKVGYYRNCRFCWSLGFACDDCGGILLPPGIYGANFWRYDGKTAAHDGYSETFQEVYVVLGTNPNEIGGTSSPLDDTCHRFKYIPFGSPGPSEAQIAADTNNCHWWDCVDCIYTGNDPMVPPWQVKMPTVTAYSLTQSYDSGPDIGSEVCIPFPSVTVEIIAADPEEG